MAKKISRPPDDEVKLSSDAPALEPARASNEQARASPSMRLLSKSEVLAIVGVTYPTLWQWMRDGRFPRSRVVGRGDSSKSVWLSSEIDAWMAALPVRRLKGDKEERKT